MGCSDSSIQNNLRNPNQTPFTDDPRIFPVVGTQSLENNQPQKNIKISIPQSEIRKVTSQTENHQKNNSYSTLKSPPLFKSQSSNQPSSNHPSNNTQNHHTSQLIPSEYSYEYLEQLYAMCQGNIEKFFIELQQKVSDIYLTISKQTLEQMNQNILFNNESKVQISEQILWFNLNILKVVTRKEDHKFNPAVFKQINKLQKNLIGYLMMKYPRGTQSFVPGDLMAVFKDFDHSEDIECDILKNSNTYFGIQTQDDLSREIKVFLNKIISELDIFYPKFQKIMQQDAFSIVLENGTKKMLNYKIGRKIPQNISKYSDMDSNTLQITSPQLFRVIIKWMMGLQEILLFPNQKINKNKNFKCFIEEDEKGNKIFDIINEDEYSDIINFELIDKIEKEKNSYNQNNQNLLVDMDKFNSHLLKLLDTSIRKQKYVPLRQMQIIKYSNLNAKFIGWVLAQKLMLALKKLIKIGKSFYNTKDMLNLDLIQFKVTDLMRCMVSGSKKQILAVYNNLRKLQNQGTIKIIKIKNRLGTSLNDVMVIFSMKDTFLISELQLILIDSTQVINQKYKNIQILNHFFYQLERSPFGILSQIAVLLAYKDSKVSYEDSITFQTNKIQIQTCQKLHPQKVVQIKQQKKPFICTKCTKYYFKFQNIFLMKNCHECNIFLCGRCIFQQNSQLQKSIIDNQINLEIQRIKAKTLTKLRNLSQSSSASSIFKIFESPYIRIHSIFGGKRVQGSKLIDYLNKRAKNTHNKIPFVLVHFRTGKAVFECLVFKPAWKQIQNPFNPTIQYGQKTMFHYSQYDLILFFKAEYTEQKYLKLQENMLHLFAAEQVVLKLIQNKVYNTIKSLKIGNFSLVFSVQKAEEDTKKNKGQTQNITKKVNVRANFKYGSLHDAISTLPDLSGAKSILKLSDLGIRSSHLQFFKQINWTANIKQLKLNKNSLSNISIVLQTCLNLERLYINNNEITQLMFYSELSKIQIVNANDNLIERIGGFQKIKNINKLLIEQNSLRQFPKVDLPNLKILSLRGNQIYNNRGVFESSLPNIQQIYLDQIDVNKAGLNRENDDQNLGLITLSFQKLKSIYCNMKIQTLLIMSQKIERIFLYDNKLTDLKLTSLQNLKYISLKSNNISNLDFLFSAGSNFENNTICEIDLFRNYIQFLPIMRSSSLIKADFSENSIMNLDNLSQSVLPILEVINLQANRITHVKLLILPKLLNLDFSSNPIEYVEDLKNQNLPSLQYLKIANSYCLTRFPILSLNKLKHFQLSEVTIGSVQNFTACNLPSLKMLTLNYCKFQVFPILNIPSLEELSLIGSSSDDLLNLQKSNLKSLKILNLSYFDIKSQQQELLPQQNAQIDALQLIENNENKIQKAEAPKESVKDIKPLKQEKQSFSCLFNFPQLKNLNLIASNFRNMQGLQKSNLPILQELLVDMCIFEQYPKLYLKNLKALSAKACQIKDIQKIVSSKLQSLQNLNLEVNFIEIAKISLSSIKIINLRQNKLTQFMDEFYNIFFSKINIKLNELKFLPNSVQFYSSYVQLVISLIDCFK